MTFRARDQDTSNIGFVKGNISCIELMTFRARDQGNISCIELKMKREGKVKDF